MSASRGSHNGTFLKSLVALFILVSLIVPQAVCAESLLILFKEGSGKTIPLNENIRKNIKQPATVGLNDNGDLVVRYGSMNVVLAYNPPEEPYKQQQPIHLAMALNQDTPTISGVSIRVNFTF